MSTHRLVSLCALAFAAVVGVTGCPSGNPGVLPCATTSDCPGSDLCYVNRCFPRNFRGPFCPSIACDTNATCVEGPPVSCECAAGYEGSGTECADVDECAAGTDDCAAGASCTNTPGGWECGCPAGYMGDGTNCTDIDECAGGTDDCSADAVCANTDGSFTCTCNAGFTGDGVTCTDDDECAAGTDDCHLYATCTNTPGGFSCACNTGYAGDGVTTCADVDECMTGTDNCDANAACANTTGSFTCTCNPGYTGGGVTCTDDDECTDGTAGCDVNAYCTNMPGSFTCTCDFGYYGDGFACFEAIGQVVWMGHDFFSRNAGVDQVLGNAVLLANAIGTIDVLGYDQYADLTVGGEAENADAAITSEVSAAGRTSAITRVSDYTLIPGLLPAADVFVIYETENGGDPFAIGAYIAVALQSFLDGGGIVIAMDHYSTAWQILDTAGVMRFLGNYTGYGDTPITVRVPSHPVMAGVPTPTYTGTNGTASYWTNDGTILAVDGSGIPVVVHKNWNRPRFSGVVGAAWELRASTTEAGYSLMTYHPEHVTGIYNMYDSTGQVYTPATNSWAPLLTAGPPANAWFSLAPVGMYLFGYEAYTTNLWRYNVATDAWTNMGAWPGGGTNEYTAAVADEAGFVYGYASNGNVIAYNPYSNGFATYATGLASLFETRVVYDPTTRLLYLGAYPAPELYSYDVATGTLATLTPIPESQLNDIFCGDRSGHIYAAGDSSGTTMWQYDIATDTWAAIPDYPTDHGNNGTCTVSDSGYLYVSNGGANSFYRLPLF